MKPSGLDFGVIIAFVAPGFVGFLAASYQLPTARLWVSAASDKEQSVGVFLFVILASLSTGLIISGIRQIVIDPLLQWSWLWRRFAVPQLPLDWSRVDTEKLPRLVTIRDNFYRYYQFYANMFVAVVCWAFGRTVSASAHISFREWLLIGFVLGTLLFAAKHSFRRYVDGVRELTSK